MPIWKLVPWGPMPAEGDASHRKQRAAHSSCPAWQPFPLSPAPWFPVRPSTDCRLQPHSQRHAWCRGRAGCTCANGEPPIEVRQRERLWTVASILVAEKRIESHVLGGLEHLSAGLHHEVGAPAKGKGQHLPNIEGLARLRVMKGHMHVMTCGIAIAGQLVDDRKRWADQWPRHLGPGTPARGVPAQAAGGQGASTSHPTSRVYVQLRPVTRRSHHAVGRNHQAGEEERQQRGPRDDHSSQLSRVSQGARPADAQSRFFARDQRSRMPRSAWLPVARCQPAHTRSTLWHTCTRACRAPSCTVHMQVHS